MRQPREPVTEWLNWRDVVAQETIVELDGKHKYKSRTLHAWPVASWRHDRRAARDTGPMSLSSFAVVELLGGRRVHLDVVLTPQAIAAIGANTIHVDDDTINVHVIVWDDGRALVVAQHSKIIGSVWLAKIDASTIPTFPGEEE